MIKHVSSYRKPEIDLAGPEGNAFMLLGTAQRFAKLLHLDADAITAEMRSGNYKHLVEVFDKYFGEHVDLVMPDAE